MHFYQRGPLELVKTMLKSDHVLLGLSPVWMSCPIVQEMISVRALVLDLAQLTCQKRFDCLNAILGSLQHS